MRHSCRQLRHPVTRLRSAWPARFVVLAGVLTSAGLRLVPPSQAQSGGGYDLTRNTIDGGGATFSTAGAFQLGGTIGQPDTGVLSAGGYNLNGGFWAFMLPEPTVTPTTTTSPTATATPTATPIPTSSRTATPIPTATPTATAVSAQTPTSTPAATATRSPSATPSATASVTPSGSPSATATATPVPCDGDCDGNHLVTVDEVLKMVNIALGKIPVGECSAGDRGNNGAITVDEIVAAVSNALSGCP